MDSGLNLFDPRFYEGIEVYEDPVSKPRMSLDAVNRLKKLKSLAEPRISLGDLHLAFKLFNPKLTATYPMFGGELKGTAKAGDYRLQYSKDF